jgi:3-oxoacyl-(acyl-carrier-protein) synthase/acyl carrier protein/GNAT superfamily N-acetyltransferase
MLDVINRLAHGFVAIPVIRACDKRGIFALLEQQRAMTADELSAETNANEGHLRIALRMLESLSWLVRDGERYMLTDHSHERNIIPTNIDDVYHQTVPISLCASEVEWSLRKWLELSKRRWDGASPLTADLLDGTVLIPLLLTLRSFENVAKPFETLQDPIRRDIVSLFKTKGWAVGDAHGAALNDAGKYLLNRIFIAGTVASYRPMLERIEDVLFGDCRSVFARGADGEERHIDRSLNVLASGFQHQTYFRDACELIRELFERSPFEHQPRYVMDTGCGDGSFLRVLYDTICNSSDRGKVLDRYPLTMIGVDYNERARDEAARQLEGIPNILLPGDINDPIRIVDDLRDQGVNDPDSILHIRSFLDHDRPFLAPGTEKSNFLGVTQAISVGSDGGWISRELALASLTESLERWSRVVGRHGVVILEVHSLDAVTAGRFVDACESIHFDAYHGFSGQQLVEPEVFLSAAAAAGLFPRLGASRRYPRVFPFTRITLHHFEKRPYLVRRAATADVPALQLIEEACWTEALRTAEDVIRRRIELNPQGQFVLESSGRVVGVCYTQPVAGLDVLRSATWEQVDSLRDDRGNALQLLGLNILPEERRSNFGDELLEYILEWAKCRNGIDQVLGVSRCSRYVQTRSAPLIEYIHERDFGGQLVDPVLRFHEMHGAEILGLVNNYRPGDVENVGCGVLIQYRLQAKSRSRQATPPTRAARSSQPPWLPPQEKCAAIEEIIRTIGANTPIAEKEISRSQSFMEMGLDSMQLLEFRSILSEKLGRTLDSTFLFRHSTIEAVVRALEPAGETSKAVVTGSEVPAARAYSEVCASVDEALRSVLGDELAAADIPLGQPFMELGLSSMQLLEFRSLLSDKFRQQLDSTFLFRYNTVEAVATALQANSSGRTLVVDFGRPRKAVSPARKRDVAIVGIAGRFPGGGLREFWKLLRDGEDAIREAPSDRWWLTNDDHEHRGVRSGGYIDRIDTFDALFFRMSPAEAELADPQQRLLLELTWELFEDAGRRPTSFRGSTTGVWIGACHFEYRELLERFRRSISGHWATGNFGSILSNRISYFFDLKGPSITIDTACSSSLVALHAAVKSLRDGECEQAIAGGVNLICSSTNTLSFRHAGMLSPTGRCRTFDADADGYVRGEGGGLVLLKPLERALADGDQIYGLVAGSAVGHGGQASSLTAPSPQAQRDVLVRAYRDADVAPAEVSYIEAHGTGTRLGDPIEMAGLKQAFQELALQFGSAHLAEQSCAVGSLKTNIGHLEGAAGIAGVLKVILALRNRMLPGNLHFNKLNPHIDLSESPFFVLAGTKHWIVPSGKNRRAGVSSFGFGGVNAHVVLEEVVPANFDTEVRRSEIVPISAKSEKQLRHLGSAILDFVQEMIAESKCSPSLEDLAWTLQDGREELDERLAIVATSLGDLEAKLRDFLDGVSNNDVRRNRVVPALRDDLFRDGREAQEFVRIAAKDGKFGKLSHLWTVGASIDWSALHLGRAPRRISLPTYPFARERYWIP